MGQYRFRILSQKAAEFCDEVKALGDKLLSVLEKKDAEGLALLRSASEIRLLEAVKDVKKQQINEAKETLDGLEKGIDVLDKRIEYYGSIPRMNTWEDFGAVAHSLGIVSEIVATVLNTVAGRNQSNSTNKGRGHRHGRLANIDCRNGRKTSLRHVH